MGGGGGAGGAKGRGGPGGGASKHEYMDTSLIITPLWTVHKGLHPSPLGRDRKDLTCLVRLIFSHDDDTWSRVCFEYRFHLNRRTCERLIGNVDLFIQELEAQNIVWVNKQKNQIYRQDSDIKGAIYIIVMSKTNQYTRVEISGVWELSFYLLNYGFIDVEMNFSGVPKVWNKKFPTKIDSVNIH